MPAATQRKKRVRLLFEAQRGYCAGCSQKMKLNIGCLHDRRATIDEVVPRAKGGPRQLGNQVAMHRRCNEAKADRMPTGCELVWLEMVNARLRKRRKIA